MRQGATFPPTQDGRRVFGVSEICAALKATLRETYRNIWVRGEISRWQVYGSGHAYFTLKDKEAALPSVMFKGSTGKLRFKPEEGMEVLARGALDFYAPRGNAQFMVEEMEVCGAGALLAAFEQLKARLAAEGLFDPARKRPIPMLPRVVGVVTSLDGAALRDFLRIAHRRNPNLRVIIAPSRVQGAEAKGEIVRALDRLERLHQTDSLDAVVVTRGGGSLEDLWPFNEEIVARRIAAFPVPTVSAVGHEVDYTIADFVADFRAATPSAAAERLAPERGAALHTLLQYARRLVHGARGAFHRAEVRYERAASSRAFDMVLQSAADGMRRVDDLERALAERLRALHGDARERIERLAAVLDQLSPLRILGRGYAVCYAEDGKTVLRDAAKVRPLDRVIVRLAKGALACDVRERKEK